MKNSILAAVSQLRRFALRPFFPCLVAASLCWGAPARAQDKPLEPSHIAGWVVIPVDEYRVLRAKAYPVEHDPEPPPLDATLTRVDYDLHVAGDLAAGKATLIVDVLKDGWVRVPVPAGLLVREARLEGKEISLVPGASGKGGAHLSALLSHAGRFELLLDVDVPIATSAGDESISLPSTESGVTRASVVLPRQGVDLKVGGGLLSEKSETSGETRWQAYARGNEALTFTWRKKTEDHHVELPLRLRGSLTQLTSLAEDSTTISAEANFEIVQGAAREVRIQLPEKVTINQVSGAMVADWEMKNGELAVTFLEPVEHSARFVISGETRLPRDGIIDIPLLRLLNTERDTGGVAVEILGAGEIKDQKAQGLEDADATDLGEMVANRQSPALVAFRARSGAAGATRSLSVNVARYDQQAVLMANIEEARYQVLMSADGKELVQARYAVRNNQRNFVKVTLPAGAAVWSVSLAGRPVRPGQSPDGSLLLPLEKSRGGDDAPAFAVEILYLTKATAWNDKGREKVTLPALDLPISRTGLLLYYPPLFKVAAEPGTFHTQAYENPVSAALVPPRAGPTDTGSARAFTTRREQPFAKAPGGELQEKKDATQALLDSFKAKSISGKVTGILPINVTFPAFGPSIFLVSELTSENQFPAAEFSFQHDKKGRCAMKNIFVVLLLCCVCVAEETSTLPLPDPGNVTLTLDEYNRLVALAANPPKRPDLAPLPYSIKHADVKLHIENDGVRGTVELEGEVFRKGVSKVPLTTGMTVLDAHQNGKGVPLLQENGTHMALLPGPGEFSVALDTGLPLRIEAGRASFSLPVPAAGSVQLKMVIPGDHTFANISPGVITSRKSESGHTAIEATLVPGQPATIWWATRETVTPTVPREVRFLSDAKTLISVSEAEMRVAVLADITVIQGEPSQFQVELPAGYEVTGATGATLDSTETQPGILTLKVNAPTQRSHQFLISMERSITSTKADAPFLTFKGSQRETGEVLVEGAGTMELTATEGGALKRMDVKEASPYLRALAHFPPQAAFRYHTQAADTPTLALQWVRFPDGSVLAAEAESAIVTTLVTSEGKSLTEVKLILKNQAQPFLKVALPPGATILSADVDGEHVKPVQGPDGSRVPLLRPGFHPTDSYTVSFVFMHSGAPFAKKGGADLSLPGMDIPISLLSWEVFLPEQYKVKDFGGDVIAANRVPPPFREEDAINARDREGEMSNLRLLAPPGQMGGYVVDPSGATVANAQVTIIANNGAARTARTDAQGRWLITGVPSGNFKGKLEMPGFQTTIFNLHYDANQPSMYSSTLNVGTTSETVEVTAQAAQMQADTVTTRYGTVGGNVNQLPVTAPAPASPQNAASANVLNLQRRVAGVLPVAIDVPHTGTSFSFVRPLVLDEETKVTFSYKSR